MVELTSDAALATLSTHPAALKADGLMRLITKVVSPLQVEISISCEDVKADNKKGGKKGKKAAPMATPETSLLLRTGSKLSHRNTILRTLCSYPFQLDFTPKSLLGGCTIFNASTISSRMVLAGVTSWMSYASTLRTSSDSDLQNVLEELNGTLKSKSFLCGTSNVSLADLDVYFALREKFSDDDLVSTVGVNANFERWFDQVQHVATDYSCGDAPSMIQKFTKKQNGPVFFYGDEPNFSEICAATARAVAETSSAKTSLVAKSKTVKSAEGVKSNAPPSSGGNELTDEQKAAAAEKRAKKAAEKAAKKKAGAEKGKGKGAAPAGSGELNIGALDIRVGLILKAWVHEEADKLYCEEVDLGEASGPRKIASGLRPFYTLDQMQNQRVLVLCNLKARNLAGFPSHGMVLCASNADHTSVQFAVPPSDAKIGERVVFTGYEDVAPEAENKVAKKKIFEKLAPDLKTSESGAIVWKDSKAMTSAGPCKGTPNTQIA